MFKKNKSVLKHIHQNNLNSKRLKLLKITFKKKSKINIRFFSFI